MRSRSAAAVALIVALLAGSGCGGSPPRRARPEGGEAAHSRSLTAAGSQSHGPAVGLTEDNADLLWNPNVDRGAAGAPFAHARGQLTALQPTYVRLLVDWAALQPRADHPAMLEAPVDGCARGLAPCGAYAGVRDQLGAIASQQRAPGVHGAFQVVLDVFGVPPWAAAGPSGCEQRGTAAFARPLSPAALASYRALVASIAALAARVGVSVAWWSPWNEPNDPRFISPQHASCALGAKSVSPTVYAQLAAAMSSALALLPGVHHLVMGELNDLPRDSPHTTSVASFVAALAPAVLCLASVWSIHAYAARHAGAPPDAVDELEHALDRRGGCARRAAIWVTEAGAGAPHPGAQRPAGEADERAGCEALAAQLLRWYADPRVGAVFQYSFREDPAFPVGLLSAELTHVYPAYRLWLRWSQSRASGGGPPSPASGCA